MTDEIIYVTSQTDISRGEEALNRLRENNDSRFQNEDGSITHVDTNRWEQAQQYERETWMTHNPDTSDDRNMTHSDAFNGYKALPKDIGDVVELGCGVFTNMRFILQQHEAKSITLVDPLIDVYKTHANCPYKDGSLREDRNVTTINSAIEDWQTDQSFDTVVIINVLHHCQDAGAVLDKIRNILNPGGYLVFHEPPREIDPLTHYDQGHPLSPTTAYLEAFLSEFEEVYRSDWYFIGRKPGKTPTTSWDFTVEADPSSVDIPDGATVVYFDMESDQAHKAETSVVKPPPSAKKTAARKSTPKKKVSARKSPAVRKPVAK